MSTGGFTRIRKALALHYGDYDFKRDHLGRQAVSADYQKDANPWIEQRECV
jgi:hypothetical protein